MTPTVTPIAIGAEFDDDDESTKLLSRVEVGEVVAVAVDLREVEMGMEVDVRVEDARDT